MTPEQVRGDDADASTDVWGIGAVLYEAATAEPPFNAEYEETGYEEDSGTTDGTGTDEWTSTSGTGTDYGLEDYEQITGRAAPVRVHRRVPAAFGEVVARCLDPDPDARPTVAELTNTLRTLTKDRRLPARSPEAGRPISAAPAGAGDSSARNPQ
jgi:serine/threonine protein kinase